MISLNCVLYTHKDTFIDIHKDIPMTTFSSMTDFIGITVNDFVEKLQDISLIESLYKNYKRTMERKLLFYSNERLRVDEEIKVTQSRISRMHLPSDQINNTFPFHICNMKLLFHLEDLIKDLEASLFDITSDNLKERLLQAIQCTTTGLASIIGRDSIKNALITRIYAFCRGINTDDVFQHTALLGPSGCGKTSLAKVTAKLFHACGMIATPKVFLFTHTDVTASFVGQSAPKMRSSLIESLESVWFLDEAYQLCSSSYGEESLTELINFLDRYNGCNLVFLAGYSKRIESELFSKNEGLDRRIPWRYKFLTMNSSTMTDILISHIKKRVCNFQEISVNEKQRNFILCCIRGNKELYTHTAGDMVNLSMHFGLVLCSSDYKWEKDWKTVIRKVFE